MLRFLRLFAVDDFDFEQRELALAFLRRPHLPGDRVAGAQIEPLDLTRRDINVIGAVEVVPISAAQETVAFGEDFEHALATQYRVGVEQRLLDAENEILLAEPGV